jgi:hypothetical protein
LHSEKASDETLFSVYALHGIAQFMPQMQDIGAAHIVQLNPYKLLLEDFAKVQLRGIGCQVFQTGVLHHAIGQKPLMT